MKATWFQFILVSSIFSQLPVFAASTGGSVPADLGVSITAGANSVALSNTVTFSFVLTNAGPSNVTTSITVSNFLSPGLQYTGSSGTGNYFYGVWTVPGLSAFTSATQSVTFMAVALGVQTNTLTVTAPSGYVDSNLTNNTASTTVTVTPPPLSDLAIGETATTNVALSNNITVPLGAQLMFVVGLTNLGPAPVTGPITATAVVPPGFMVATNSSGSYSDTYNASNGIWTIPQITTSNGYILTITTIATNLGSYTLTSTVAVPPQATDPNLSNNTSSVMVTVRTPQADLAIVKSVNSNAVYVGQQVIFNLAVTNLGPDNVTNNIGPVNVMDLLPAGFQYLTDTSGGTYNASSGIWTLAALGATTAGASLQITATAAKAGKYTNMAVVNVPPMVTDPNISNNSSSAIVTVTATNQTTNVTPSTLSGYVRGCTTNGTGFANVTITLTGATNLTTTTGTNGFYSVTNLSPGTYGVTPSQAGNTFTPPNVIVTLNSNTTLPTFIAGLSIIQGSVTYGSNGPGIAGIPVQTMGQAERTVLTDSNGNYIFTNCAAGFYVVSAQNTNGFIFTPSYSTPLVLNATNCNGQAIFVAAPRIVQLVALEVTQVIQDWSNTVPLVSAKRTYVRAHLQLPYSTNQLGVPITPPGILLTGARLYNLAAPGSPQAPLNTNGSLLVQTTNAATVRGNWASALDFELPPAWCSGNLSLQFVCTNNVTVVPTNTVPTNSTLMVTFTPATILPVKYFAWNLTNTGTLQQISQPAYADLPGRLLSMYPVPDANKTSAVQARAATLQVPLPIPPTIPASEKIADWILLNSNAKLVLYRAFDTLLGGRFGSGGSNWIYFGAIAGPSPGTTGWAKAYVTTTNTVNYTGNIYVSSAFIISNFYSTYRHTPSHEIGHNLGRPHDVMTNASGVCGEGASNNTPAYPLFQNVPPPAGPIKPALGPMTNGTNALIYGLDTLTLNTTNISPVVSPLTYFDVMSYCKLAPLDRWISTYTYQALRTAISNGFTPPVPPVPGPPRQWFYIRGYIDFTSGLGGFLPFWTTSSTSTNPPPGSPAGPYEVIVYDINGNVLETAPFAPDQFIVEEGDFPAYDEGEFLVPVPVVPNMAAVEVMNSNNQSFATITASPALPSVSGVTLTGPNGQPFTGTGPLIITWQTQDSNPNAQLLYAIQYSTDGGNTWETLDMDVPGPSYQIDSLYLSASVNALIRVLASDGFNTSPPANSTSLVIPNHPPIIVINTPGSGDLFTVDQEIFFDASVLDPQDGPLTGNNVQWNSSLDGFLGYGAVLDTQASLLSEGLSTITVTATDNEGLSSSASVQIFVLHQPQPELSIQLTGDEVMLSWPSSVTNFALLSTGDLALGAWSPVSTMPVAADSTQTVTLGLTNQAQFFILQMK